MKGAQVSVEKYSMVIATYLTFTCCVYKEKIVKNDKLFSFFANTPFNVDPIISELNKIWGKSVERLIMIEQWLLL